MPTMLCSDLFPQSRAHSAALKAAISLQQDCLHLMLHKGLITQELFGEYKLVTSSNAPRLPQKGHQKESFKLIQLQQASDSPHSHYTNADDNFCCV